MSVLPVIIAPDERLKIKSKPVDVIDDETKQFVADMFDTMYHERGIGLAAVQVGVHERILIADVNWNDKTETPGDQHVMINPEIIESSDDINSYKEGCLSLPDMFAEVKRPKSIKVKFQDLDGKPQELQADGLLATCIQHEIDHLNGVIFVDHTSSLKRDMILRKLKKLKKQGAFDHDHHHVHDENCNH